MYFHTAERRDIVKASDGAYYLTDNTGLSGDPGSDWTDPTIDDSDWEAFGAQFSSVATDVLLAQDVFAEFTINVGSSAAGSASISLNADATNGNANPFISIGQSEQAFNSGGIYIGYDSEEPVFSMVSNAGFIAYNTGGLQLSGVPYTDGTITGGSLDVGRNANIPVGQLGDYNFKVFTNGAMSASQASIQGQVQATSGKIGDWVIDEQTSELRDTNAEIVFEPNIPEIQLYQGDFTTINVNSDTTSSVTFANNQLVIIGSGSTLSATGGPYPAGVGGDTLNLKSSTYLNKIVGGVPQGDGNMPNSGYYFDLSDSSMAGHKMAFSYGVDGIHNGYSEFNHYTSLNVANGQQSANVQSSSILPGNPGAFVRLTVSHSVWPKPFNYYDPTTALAGGGVNYERFIDFTDTVVTGLNKRVLIGAAHTLLNTEGVSSNFTWATAVTYTDTDVTSTSQATAAETIESSYSSDQTITMGQVVLGDIDLPTSYLLATGIPNSTTTIANPNYTATYEGQVHGGMDAYGGGQAGVRYLRHYIKLSKSSDDSQIALSQVGYQAVVGAKSSYYGYVADDGGFQSVIGTTEITLADGSIKLAKDITLNDTILAWDDTNKKLVPAVISNISKRNVSEIYEVTVDGNVIEVSDSHGFWLFGDSINSGQVLAKTLYTGQHDNLEIWVRDGDTIKKSIVTYVRRILKETEVITFTVPTFVNYISNNIISHNVAGWGGFTWIITTLSNGSSASATSTLSGTSTLTRTVTSTFSGLAKASYEVQISAAATQNMTISANGTVSYTYGSVSTNFGMNANSNNAYFAYTTTGPYGNNNHAWSLASDNNFIEIQPAGIQVVSDSNRYVRMAKEAAASAVQTLLELKDGQMSIFSRDSTATSIQEAGGTGLWIDGHINAGTDSAWDIGSTSKRFANLWIDNLNGSILSAVLESSGWTGTGTSYQNPSTTRDNYIKLHSGVIIQWGMTGSSSTIIFPTAFPTCFDAGSVASIRSGDGSRGFNYIYNPNQERMTIVKDSSKAFWIAFGH